MKRGAFVLRSLKQRPLKRYTVGKFLLLLLPFYIVFMIYGIYKPFPDESLSYDSGWHDVSSAQLLLDETFTDNGATVHDHVIFEKVEEMINEAESFILVDMFLFNDEYPADLDFPTLSNWLSAQLALKKQENPDMTIVVTTDRINSFYDSREPAHIEFMRSVGIHIVWTDMSKAPDSNPIYSGAWRAFMQWFGTPAGGYLPSPFSSEAEPVTLRGYLDLLNSKANHRKVVLTEQSGLVTSANAHDASAYHSNVAFYVEGELVHHLLETEKAVARFSGAEDVLETLEANPTNQGADENIQGKVVTEYAIKAEILRTLQESGEGSEVWLGLFYLSDRDVINELKDVAERGAIVRLILDGNSEAFGHEKNGVPNRPVADELERAHSNIQVRWYNTDGEQYHTKMMYITNGNQAVVTGGSANFTRRNLDDYNLETNVMFAGSTDHEMMQQLDKYFVRLWNNEEDQQYTLPYAHYGEQSQWKYWLYRVQESTGLSAF